MPAVVTGRSIAPAVGIPAVGVSTSAAHEGSKDDEKRAGSVSALDDIAASAARLTARQRQQNLDEICLLDAIPHLSRPLEQLRRDTTAAAAAHPSPTPGTVQAPAVRLLASAPGFEPDRLRRAVSDFSEMTQHPARAAFAAADSGGFSWLEDPSSVPEEDLSIGALQRRHRQAIVSHAADHLRLDSSLAFRNAFHDSMQQDLALSKFALVATLRGVVDPSAAIPKPFASDKTPEHARISATFDGVSGAASENAGQNTSSKTPGTSSRPPRSGGRPPLPGSGRATGIPGSASGKRDAARTASTGGTPLTARSTPGQPGTPNPRNVPTADPDADYVAVIREHILGVDAPFEVATRLLEHARSRGDHPHFIACLSLISDLCGIASSRSSSHKDDDISGPLITQHDLVCSARSVFESFFGHFMGTIPLDREQRSVAAVRNGVRAYVQQLVRNGTLKSTPDHREHSQAPVFYGNLPFWPQLYFCLRCGSPAAALQLADDAHDVLDEEGTHFRFYLHEFLRRGQSERAKFAKAEEKEKEKERKRKRVDRLDDGEGSTGDNSDVSDGSEGTIGDESVRRMLELTNDSYMARNVPGTLTDPGHYHSMAEEYETSVFDSGDPYRRASYALLARLDVSSTSNAVNGGGSNHASGRHTGHHKLGHHGSSASGADSGKPVSFKLRDEDYGLLFGSLEDFYWFRLWLCRTDRESEVVRHLGSGVPMVNLTQLGNEVLSFGHSYFDPQCSQPLLYALVLISVGHAWEAVEYLASQQSPELSAYAAYLALPLYAMNWAPDEARYISVMWAYVIHFACDHPKEAAMCLFTVKDRSLLRKSLQSLVVDSGKILSLLGNGRDVPGDLEDLAREIQDAPVSASKRPGSETDPIQHADSDIVEFVRTLKQQLAEEFAKEYARPSNGRDTPSNGSVAALLYAITGDSEREREVILANLADHVAAQGSGTSRERCIAAARHAISEGQASGRLSDNVQSSLLVLLDMAKFFDDYWQGEANWERAWTRLEAMAILPFETDSIRDRQLQWTLSSTNYRPPVLGRLPDLVRAALVIAESHLGRESNQQDGFGIGAQASQIVALTTFAGLMGLSETEMNARLVRLELLLAS